MNPLIAIIFLFISSYLSAQQQEQAIKPICGIHVTTMQENKMKGLLLMTKDSLLIVYPGKRKDWNKGKKYSPVIFSCSRIKRITIKKKYPCNERYDDRNCYRNIALTCWE